MQALVQGNTARLATKIIHGNAICIHRITLCVAKAKVRANNECTRMYTYPTLEDDLITVSDNKL